MMYYEWDLDKATEVEENHGITFDEIVSLIGRGFLWKIMQNPSKKHSGQKIFLVQKNRSIYMVPFEKRNGKIRLVTVFHSKAFTESFNRIKLNEKK